ncbi:thiopurine S-methyltransferase [Salinisphaera orenii]|uniref:thiopurine S-methyltransferase n=1 Tax=Salinisphaera orenii TaxID=856731 RepID=UPI0013A670D2
MTPATWLEKWQTGPIRFHQPDGHPALIEHWASLEATGNERVLVPLCGKARDMATLAERGHAVHGIELSQRAAIDFFAESGLTPSVLTHDPDCYRGEWPGGGAVEIDVGDFFELADRPGRSCELFFDRAALIALPPSTQARYVAQMSAMLAYDARGLLITLEYPDSAMSGPPFSIPEDEVRKLFNDDFVVTRLASRDVLSLYDHLRDNGLPSLYEHVFQLRRRTG